MRPIDAEPLEEILRSRCAQYSNDYGSLAGAISGCLKLVQAQPTIAPQPNAPLTLEQLREMDGEPVWVERYDGGPSRWAIVGDFESLYVVYFCTAQGGLRLPYDEYGKTWLAYRRRPEEETWQQ